MRDRQVRPLSVLSPDEVRRLLARAIESTSVLAPVRRGRSSFAFAWIQDPAEAVFSYPRTILPPKQALLPPREDLFTFERTPEPVVRPPAAPGPITLFGVHPCDLAAIGQLDWAMQSRHDITDPNYAARRAETTIIGLECLPDEYCFCPSVGTANTREGADLFLTPIGDGFVAEALTEKGNALLESVEDARAPTPEELAVWKGWADNKESRASRRLEARPEELPDLLEAEYESDVWEATAARCYGCGTCTSVCPTCFCFDVEDMVEVGLASGARRRQYDSCQFPDFALVAGGHNFRGERPDRVRHRWFRKFVYLNREHGRAFCVGCGRCTKACTADIGLVEVLNAVIAEARREEAE